MQERFLVSGKAGSGKTHLVLQKFLQFVQTVKGDRFNLFYTEIVEELVRLQRHRRSLQYIAQEVKEMRLDVNRRTNPD